MFFSNNYPTPTYSLPQNSAVAGPRGLIAGEPLTGVGDCKVTSIGDWHSCLLTSMKEPSLGHCLPVTFIKEINTTPKSE